MGKSPDNKIIKVFYEISVSKISEYIILLLVFINLIILAIDFEGAPPLYEVVAGIINNTTTGIFIGEALVKLIGLGHVGYFESHWNRFDFFIVISAIVDIFFVIGIRGNTDGNSVKFLKTFQILRILRMIRVTR